MELLTTGHALDYPALQRQYGITDSQLADLQKMVRRVPLDLSDWTLCTEREFRTTENFQPATDGEQSILDGHIDLLAFHTRIDGLAMVIDYKSGFQEAEFWQLAGYTLSVFAKFPDVKLVMPRYYYSRTGRWAGRNDEDGNPKPYTREEAMGLWKSVSERCKEAMFGKRRYVQSSRCVNCAAFTCPSWRDWRKSLLTAPDGQTLMQGATITDPKGYVKTVLPKLRVLSAIVDEITETLKSIVRIHGAVDLGDGTTYENRPQERMTVNLARSIPLLLELGTGDPRQVLSLYDKISKDQLYEFVQAALDRPWGPKHKQLLEALDTLNAVEKKMQERIAVHPKQLAEED
jgi:hypothetical protein